MFIFLWEPHFQCGEICPNSFMCCMCSLYSLRCFLIKRKKQSQRENNSDKTPIELNDIPRASVDTTGSVANPVYQNVADIHQHRQGNLRCYHSMHGTIAKASFLAL